MLQVIEDLGITDNTVIIYTSDNGAQMVGPNERPDQHQIRFNKGLKGNKNTVYEGRIRLPAFFRWPGEFMEWTVFDQHVAHIDFFPTILDICNIPVPDGITIDGVSLLPALKDANVKLSP